MFFSSSTTSTRGGVGTASVTAVSGACMLLRPPRLLSLPIHLQQEISCRRRKRARRVFREELGEGAPRIARPVHFEIRLAEQRHYLRFQPRAVVATKCVLRADDGRVELVASQVVAGYIELVAYQSPGHDLQHVRGLGGVFSVRVIFDE